MPACRGHFGGLLGGALTAYLLGPCLVVDRTQKRYVDRPPVPLFSSRL